MSTRDTAVIYWILKFSGILTANSGNKPTVMSSVGKARVLSLYRKIWRTARKWSAVKPEDTAAERQYIEEEARRLFRQNAQLKSSADIEQRILEAEARLDMALHYKNPYPRLSNMPPSTVTLGKGRKESEKLRQRTLPAHLKSYESGT